MWAATLCSPPLLSLKNMITPIEVPMPEDWQIGTANRIMNEIEGGWKRKWADDFIAFQKENKQGDFFEAADQAKDEDALAEGEHEQAVLEGREKSDE